MSGEIWRELLEISHRFTGSDTYKSVGNVSDAEWASFLDWAARMEDQCAASCSHRQGFEAEAVRRMRESVGADAHQAILLGSLGAVGDLLAGCGGSSLITQLQKLQRIRGDDPKHEQEWRRAAIGGLNTQAKLNNFKPKRGQKWPSKPLGKCPHDDLLESEHHPLGQELDSTELDLLPDARPIIDGWLERGTVAIAAGDTGTYKTFMLFGWACCLATGTDWLGYSVHGRYKVLYIAGEGGRGLKYRLAAWQEANDVDIPKGMLTVRLMPDLEIHTAEFWQLLSAYVREESGAQVIILDTFSSLAPSADEVKDAATVVRAGAGLASAIDGSVVLALHTGWGDKKRVRGGSQWESNADTVIITSRTKPADEDEDNSAPREIWRKKDKDGPSNIREYVSLEPTGKSGVLKRTDAPELMGGQAEAMRAVEEMPGKSASAMWPNGGAKKEKMLKALEQLERSNRVCRHSAKPRGEVWWPIGSCPEPTTHTNRLKIPV